LFWYFAPFALVAAIALAVQYHGGEPTRTQAEPSKAAPTSFLTEDMRSCLARRWRPIVLASLTKPKLHADDKDEDASVLWGKILDACDVRPNEELAATNYVKSLMK
jgi:hypothetical protein